MATYGFDGSTLVDELNRLANFSYYPPREEYKDAAAAAYQWAQIRGVYLDGGVTDTVGLLNLIEGTYPDDRQYWKDLAGVCNAIAGTTGLEPAAALREVMY